MDITLRAVEDLIRALNSGKGPHFAVVHGTNLEFEQVTWHKYGLIYLLLTGYGSFQLPLYRSLIAFYGNLLGFDPTPSALSPLDGLNATGFVSASPTRISGPSIIARLSEVHQGCRAVILESFCTSLTTEDVTMVKAIATQALGEGVPIYLLVSQRVRPALTVDNSAIYMYLAGGKMRRAVLDRLTCGGWDSKDFTIRDISAETWVFPASERLMSRAAYAFQRRGCKAQRDLISRFLRECSCPYDYRWEVLAVDMGEEILTASYSVTTLRLLLGAPVAQTRFFRRWRQLAKRWPIYGTVCLNYLAFVMMTNQHEAIRVLRMGLKNDHLLYAIEKLLPDLNDRAKWLFALYQYGVKFGSQSLEFDSLERLFEATWSLIQAVVDDEVTVTSHQVALLNTRALLYTNRGNITEAINLELQAYQLSTSFGDTIPQSQRVLILTHLGDLYRKQRDLEAARNFYQRGMDHALDSGDEKAIKYVAMKYLATSGGPSSKAKSIERALINIMNRTEDRVFLEGMVKWYEKRTETRAKSPSDLGCRAQKRLSSLIPQNYPPSDPQPLLLEMLAALPPVSVDSVHLESEWSHHKQP